MRRVLLLNASFEPLNFISDVRAVTLVLKNRAEVLVNMTGNRSVWPNVEFRSPSRRIQVPATIRLFERVKRRWKPPRFRKKVLFNRDHWHCQYCGKHLKWDSATVDHVLPSSMGGATSWMNCVTSCRSCNRRKANRTPDEAGMVLARRPVSPTSMHFWNLSKSNHWHDDWEMFLERDE